MEKHETTPDELLGSFKGRSLKSIIVFTVVVHAVILVGSSIPSLVGGFVGEDTSAMDEDARLAAATEKAKAALENINGERDREANAALAKIAESYGLKPQDLGERVESKASGPSVTSKETEPSTPPAPAGAAGPEEPGEPKSAIEEEIEKVEPGPEVPPIGDEEEDLFK
jgi:hypothetical protein